MPNMDLTEDSTVPQGADRVLMAAASGTLPAVTRGLALSVGLQSQLYDAPNSLAGA